MKNFDKFFTSSVIASLIIISLSTGLVNTSTYVNRNSIPFVLGQVAHAANELTQTSTEVNNCDPSSSCTTTPEQTTTIEVGNGNQISQDIILRNLHCTNFSTCDLVGNERVNLGETGGGIIFDEGTNNINSQVALNDANSVNNNDISQQTKGENNDCHDNADCISETEVTSSVGRNLNGIIFNPVTSSDNTNTQLNIASGSSNDNDISQTQEQNNKFCNAECINSVRDIQNIGFMLGEIIGAQGNGNTNTEIMVLNGSANGNTITSTGNQENSHCTNPGGISHFCSNGAIQSAGIGSTHPGAVFVDSNSVNSVTLLTVNSSNNNTVADNSLQQNKQCEDSQCENSVVSGPSLGLTGTGGIFGAIDSTNSQNSSQISSTNQNEVTSSERQVNNDCRDEASCSNGLATGEGIGRTISSPIFDTGTNNTHTQNILQIGGSNGNIVNTYGSQDNNNCRTDTDCLNLAGMSGSIGGQSGPFLDDSGNNNSITLSITNINSANNNKVDQRTAQENIDCTVGSFCFNAYESGAIIQPVSAGITVNSGDNNLISSTIVVTNSANNNKINQEADQTNQHCSKISSCSNSAITDSNIVLSHDNIVNDESNKQIVESSFFNDINNENSISQQVKQDNLCREDSECGNTGNLTANINGQNNQVVDQSLRQNNLCLSNAICNNDGKVVDVSGSNTQSNTCVSGASCLNNGTDNKNICTNGAACTNIGTNTKIISNGDPCSNTTDNSIMICSHGRIINRPT